MTNEELKITCRELMDALDDVKKSVLKAKTAMHNIEGLLQKESLDSSDDRDDGYKTGIETAWKYARKIELLNMGETKKCFCLDDDNEALFPINKFDFQKAADMVDAYEKSKADNEIEVGDVVVDAEENGVVLRIDNDHAEVLWACGITTTMIKDSLRKTGKRNENIIKAMKELGEI